MTTSPVTVVYGGDKKTPPLTEFKFNDGLRSFAAAVPHDGKLFRFLVRGRPGASVSAWLNCQAMAQKLHIGDAGEVVIEPAIHFPGTPVLQVLSARGGIGELTIQVDEGDIRDPAHRRQQYSVTIGSGEIGWLLLNGAMNVPQQQPRSYLLPMTGEHAIISK